MKKIITGTLDMRFNFTIDDVDDGGGSVVITPESFADLTHWWRADSLVGIVSDGQPVGDVGKEWVDSKAGVKAQQTTASQRPTFVLSWNNGQPAVKCHTDITAPKFLQLNSVVTLPGIPGQITIVAVGSLTIISGNPNFNARHVSRVGQPDRIGSKKSGADYIPMHVDSGNVDAAFTAWTGSNLWVPAHAISFTRTGGGGTTARYNNSDEKTGAVCPNGVAWDGISLGTGFGDNVDMYIAEIIHYNRVLTNAELTSLYDSYLKPRYAL